MLTDIEIQNILSRFGLAFQSVTQLHDTSRSEEDQRLNYILDNRYVLKVNSASVMQEARLQEISRLIAHYRSIGIYCPAMIPTLEGSLSCRRKKDGKEYTCYVEEFAIYPVYDGKSDYDRKKVVEHLGVLAARYTGIDLTETKSMWSIIDLAPLDVNIDEKQENADLLTDTLRKTGYTELAEQVEQLNCHMRSQIMTVFSQLPRCVYQGDLNSSNELYQDGCFVGLIDFNLSGTDVNINVFLNETNCFPEEEEFDSLPVAQLLEKMDAQQQELLSAIFKHYTMNAIEEFAFPYYQRIADLFQYPNVCSMVQWLKEDARKEKCAALIQALVDKPL